MSNQSSPSGSYGPYYYLLGYPSQFWTEEDKATGERIIKETPELAQGARLNHESHKYFSRLMVEAGVQGFIDLASGVPIGGVHMRVPELPVIYNDNDPNVIKLMQQHISDAPNVRVVESRLENIEQILEVAAHQFGGQRKLGIFMMAVVYFVADDQQLRYVAQRLYDWTAPGSILALSAIRPSNEPGFQRLSKEYEARGMQIKHRSEDELLDLLQPWQLHPAGVRELEEIAEEVEHQTFVHPGRRGHIGFGMALIRP